MPRLFGWEEVHRLVGEASKYCAAKLLKEGKFGSHMTVVNFKAHKKCIREYFKQKVLEKIGGLAAT